MEYILIWSLHMPKGSEDQINISTIEINLLNYININHITFWRYKYKSLLHASQLGEYDVKLFNIKYTINDNSISNGVSCKDYSKAKFSYGHCLEHELKKDLLSLLGCLPPWFPKAGKECYWWIRCSSNSLASSCCLSALF